ncbi:MAG TPA: transglycosylase SLT domain-containing protein, partial [Acidimicrobiia bacterium]|nr:transglycosylase SLT domain-containing protein [Acidimicrobiia bacterium]
MGARRAAAFATAGLLVIALVPIARAQSVDEARHARDSADRLVGAAVANRDAIELELLEAMERYQDLSLQLAEVSSDLESLGERIVRTGFELQLANDVASERAVAAYMQAVALPSAVVFGTSNLESAMVAQRSFALLSGEDNSQIHTLAITERDLRTLEDRYRIELIQVQALQLEVDAQADHLEELFIAADQEVAAAISSARAADVAYREALDEAARARAVAAEREKRQQSATTTTTRPPSTSIGTTTTTASGAGGSRTFSPTVERWRSLVAQYFPVSMVDDALAVIDCESRGYPDAYNPYSGASGLFQFIPGTWAVASVKAGFSGASPFEPEPNVASAWWLVSYYQSR